MARCDDGRSLHSPSPARAIRSFAPCCRCGRGWCSASSSSSGCRWSPSSVSSPRRSTRVAMPPATCSASSPSCINGSTRCGGSAHRASRSPILAGRTSSSPIIRASSTCLLISQLPWEMKWLSKEDFFKYPLVGWLMRMAGDIKLIRGKQRLDRCGDGFVQGPPVEARQRDDLPGGHPQQRRRVAASSRTARSAWPSRPAHPSSRWCSTAPTPRCRRATGDSVSPTPRCACSSPSRPPGLTIDDVSRAPRSRAHHDR